MVERSHSYKLKKMKYCISQPILLSFSFFKNVITSMVIWICCIVHIHFFFLICKFPYYFNVGCYVIIFSYN